MICHTNTNALPLTTSALKTLYHRRFIIKFLLFVYSAFIGLWLCDKELIGIVFPHVLSDKMTFSPRWVLIKFHPQPCFVATANWNKFLLIRSLHTYKVQTVEFVMEILLFLKAKHGRLENTFSPLWSDNKFSLSITRQFPRTKATNDTAKSQLAAETNGNFHFIVIQHNYLQLKSITHRRKCRKDL